MEKLPKPARLSLFQNLFVFGLARFISRTLMTILGRAKCFGARQVPKRGGLLILANHCADVDPLMVQMCCPRNVIFMAKSDLYQIKFLAMLMRAGSTFPVKRGEPDRSALRHTSELLKLDQAVCIFPEGQLSDDGELQEVKPGISLIIRMAEPQVICLGLQNTNGVMPYGTLTPRFSPRKVIGRWGQPRRFDRDSTTDEIVSWVTGELLSLTK